MSYDEPTVTDKKHWQDFSKNLAGSNELDFNALARSIDATALQNSTQANADELAPVLKRITAQLKNSRYQLIKNFYLSISSRIVGVTASMVLGLYFGISQAWIENDKNALNSEIMIDAFAQDIFVTEDSL